MGTFRQVIINTHSVVLALHSVQRYEIVCPPEIHQYLVLMLLGTD